MSPYPQSRLPPACNLRLVQRRMLVLSPHSPEHPPKGFQLCRFQKWAEGRKTPTEGRSEEQATEERNRNFLASHGTVCRERLGRTRRLPPTQSSQHSRRTRPGISSATHTVVAALPGLPESGATLGGGFQAWRRMWCPPGTGASSAGWKKAARTGKAGSPARPEL